MNITVRKFLKDYAPVLLSVQLSQRLDRNVKKSFRKRQYSPEWFQRRTVWGRVNKQELIKSLIEGIAANPIHLLDRKETLEYAKQCDDQESYNYYNQDSHEWWNLDGQQRSNAIVEFVENKFKLTGKYTDSKQREYDFGTGKSFSELTEREQDNFLELPVSLNVMKNLTKKKCHEVFLRLNMGMSLNEMEKLNALDTPTAHQIRELAKTHEPVMKTLCNQGNWDRLEDHKWLARLAVILKNGDAADNGSADLKRLYKSEISHKVYDALNSTHDWWGDSLRNNQKNLYARTYLLGSIYVAGKLISGKKVKPGVERQMRIEIEKGIDTLYQTSKRQFGADFASFQSGQLADEPEQNEYFFEWCKWMNTEKYLQKIMTALKKYLSQNTAGYFI